MQQEFITNFPVFLSIVTSFSVIVCMIFTLWLLGRPKLYTHVHPCTSCTPFFLLKKYQFFGVRFSILNCTPMYIMYTFFLLKKYQFFGARFSIYTKLYTHVHWCTPMYTFSNCLYTDVKINLGLFLGHSRIFLGFQQLIFHYITFLGFQQLIFHYITRLYIYIANPCHLSIKTFCIAIIFLFFILIQFNFLWTVV